MLVVMLFSTMVACGKKPAGGGGSSSKKLVEVTADNLVAYDGSEVTIKFDHTMGENLRTVLDTYIADFNKIYPNIHVEHEQVGSYADVRDQIGTKINAGNQPHIAYCYPDHVALYNMAKVVQPLDVFIDSEIESIGLSAAQKADFIEAYYEEGRQFGDNKMYTMPFSKSTEVLYYNATFFAKYAGEPYNLKVPTTWDEMEETCRKIKEIDPDSIPLGYDSESNWFITMCEQLDTPYTSATGEHFLFDNAENKAFIKRFREWYVKGYVTTQEIHGSYTSSLFVEQDETKVHSYMSIGSSAGATHQRPAKGDAGYPFEVGITSIPQANENNKKVISQGPSVCIFKKANIQETIASWLLVKFLTTSVEFQASFSMASGYVPVLKSVATNPVYAGFLASADGGDFVAALSAKVCLEQEAYYYASPAFVGSSEARDQVGSIIQIAFVNDPETMGMTLDQFLDEVFADAISECERAAG